MKISVAYNVRNEQVFLPYSMMSMQYVADEYVIIDHASTDKTKEMVKRAASLLKQPVRYEYVPKEKGELYTKNLKFQRSTGDWVFILDGDELFAYEWIDKIVKQIPQKQQEGKRGLCIDMVEFMTFNSTCGKMFDKTQGYAGQGRRPRIVKRDCNFECIGSSWRNNGFFIDGVWHRDDSTWDNVKGYIYHYDRLKIGSKERIEKIITHVQSIRSNLTREQIKNMYILPPDGKYHKNAFLKQEAFEFRGFQPKVFEEYSFWDLQSLIRDRESIQWCPEASSNLVIENKKVKKIASSSTTRKGKKQRKVKRNK